MTEKVMGAAPHTPTTVLERVVSDLALSVGDLAMCHPVDGARELLLKLAGIAQCATRAAQELNELDQEGAFEAMQAEADRGVALDRRVS